MRQLQLEAEEHRKQKKRQNVSGLHRLARGLSLLPGIHSGGTHTVSTASPGFRESVPGRGVIWGRVAIGTSTKCLGQRPRQGTAGPTGWDWAPWSPRERALALTESPLQPAFTPSLRLCVLHQVPALAGREGALPLPRGCRRRCDLLPTDYEQREDQGGGCCQHELFLRPRHVSRSPASLLASVAAHDSPCALRSSGGHVWVHVPQGVSCRRDIRAEASACDNLVLS